jgi:hypothetical protein
MNTAATTLVKVEDHEGFGACSHCNREGLRWICTLSDGTTCGTECAKKVMGWKPAIKAYCWTANFTATAEHDDHGTVYVLWTHKSGNGGAISRNGELNLMGSYAHDEWARRAW